MALTAICANFEAPRYTRVRVCDSSRRMGPACTRKAGEGDNHPPIHPSILFALLQVLGAYLLHIPWLMHASYPFCVVSGVRRIPTAAVGWRRAGGEGAAGLCGRSARHHHTNRTGTAAHTAAVSVRLCQSERRSGGEGGCRGGVRNVCTLDTHDQDTTIRTQTLLSSPSTITDSVYLIECCCLPLHPETPLQLL